MSLRAWFLGPTYVLALIVLPAVARADFIIGGVAYHRVGAGESLTATFTTPTGGITTNTYTGYIEVSVSGTGQAYGPALSDAFYVYTDFGGTLITPTSEADGHYQLAGDIIPLQENAYDQATRHFMAYDVQAGMEVSPGYIPAYRADHQYDFIVKAGNIPPSILYLGVADGIYSDNSGAFSITITQLAAVPEPSSLALVGIGLTALAWVAARQPGRPSR